MEIDWGSNEMADPFAIVIDHRYQRVEKPGLIQRIAANFDPMLFGRPICFRRENGMLYCIDGQQRIAGAKAAADKMRSIPVVSFNLVGVQREAEVFVAVNQARKALTGLEKHRGKVVAKDVAAIQMARAVETAGFSIGVNYQSPRAIASVASLGYAHGLIAEDGLVQLLTVTRESWGDDRKAVDGAIIRTLADIIDGQSKNGGYSRGKLVTALKRTSPAQLLRKAEELHFEHGTSKMVSLRNAFKALAKV